MPSEIQRHVFEVNATAAAVPVARHHAAEVLRGWNLDPDVVFIAGLILTELVTNVAQHAVLLSPTATVTLLADDGALTLAVADRHPFRPRALPAAHNRGGRGLALVKQLAEEVGGTHDVLPEPATGGKSIEIRLPLARAVMPA